MEQLSRSNETILLAPDIELAISRFLRSSKFSERGAILTDLDGTAVHEVEGKHFIPPEVEFGLKELQELGRPVIINSLRFPLSVLRTFGRAWFSITKAPIPTVTLNGSLLGYINQDRRGELIFEELHATPLTADDIEQAISIVQSFLEDDVRDILVFYYPRDWRVGEVIWTPVAENILAMKEKYTSASSVTAVELSKLEATLLQEQICMMFLLVNVPEDKRMAYQHTRPSNFFSHSGVDKLFGAQQMARLLGFELTDSIGAGDTPMDTFLSGVGLAIHVGPIALSYHGHYETVQLESVTSLGKLLFRIAAIHRRNVP